MIARAAMWVFVFTCLYGSALTVVFQGIAR